MSKQVLAVIFEHGMFRPLTAMTPTISEGRHVQLVIEPMPQALDLAPRVHDGLPPAITTSSLIRII